MTHLTQQLEDKKKEHEKLLNDYIFKENEFLNLRKDINNEEYCDIWGELWEICCDKEVKKAEIAILEQAIAEMQKQRQDFIERIEKFSDFMYKKTGTQGWNRNWKPKEGKAYWEELKEQLNQPKTENDN